MRMVPDFISIDANHVEKNLFMQALNFVLDTVSIIAMHELLVGRFDSNDEKLFKNLDQHLLKCLMAWLDIHFG